MRPDFSRRHRTAATGAGESESASDGSAACVDRRILGRCHHQQVARRHHSKLERRGRTSVRLHRRASCRSPYLPRHPTDRIAEEDHIIASLKAGQRIDHFETERVRSRRPPIFVSLTVSPIRDDAGRVVGASKIVRDITERKRAEADREKFVTLVENSTDFIGMCD